MLLDSKPSAGGRIAADLVKAVPADGGALLQMPSSPTSLYPDLEVRKLPCDRLTDFAQVAPLATYCMSMTVGPGVPTRVKTIGDFVACARASP